MNKLKVLELYSGIGGMHYALKDSQIDFVVLAALEINPIANLVYKHNFPNTNVVNKNICSISSEYINKLNCNAIFMSPPCQPFTRNGKQNDINDTRTDSFLHLLNIFKEITCIEFVLLENVKEFSQSQAKNLFINQLNECGFYFKEFILSPTEFGIPNSRTRYYCIAKKIPFKECVTDFEKRKQPFTLNEVLEQNIDNNKYFLNEKQLKYRSLLDIVNPSSTNSCCFTKSYGRFLEGTGSVITCTPYNDLRFFSPKEISRLMCFPDSFNFPEVVSDKQKYNLLGNSINVLVVSELIKLLIFQ